MIINSYVNSVLKVHKLTNLTPLDFLIAREHKTSTFKLQFSEYRNKARAKARTKQEKQGKVSDIKFITTYNPALPNINKIIQNNLSILHTNEDMKKFCTPNSLTAIYRKEKNLKEILSLQSVVVINVLSAKIILYLIINLSV